jgi:16S rRNA (cytosine967-C5)-methyltransferase
VNAARLAALRVLTAVERGQTTLPEELDRFREGLADPRDRGLLLELTAGVLRWRNALDAAVAAASHRPLADLTPEVRAILRLGAYQLRHLDRVPAHAVVHQAVELTRAIRQPQASGFVNGVLRGLLRRGDALGLPPKPGPGGSRADQVAYLAVTLSHPAWLVERWIDAHGFDAAERWCRFNNAPPDLAVRAVRPDQVDLSTAAAEAGVVLAPAAYAQDALIAPAGALGRIPAALRDQLVVQEEGSQLVASCTPVRPGGRLLDLCAAPGNKTVLLATRPGGGFIVAADRRSGRLRLLAATLERAGLRVPILRLDAARPLPFGASFDTVLLDAPCSGLGTLRRDPDLKWRRSPADLPRFAEAQRAMLLHAADAARTDGCVVYATCSSEPEENAEVVDAFLAVRPDFGVRPIGQPSGVHDPERLIDDRGFLRTWPHAHGLDAFFAAVLVRRQPA